jgi:hypothetical protein
MSSPTGKRSLRRYLPFFRDLSGILIDLAGNNVNVLELEGRRRTISRTG